MDRHEVEVNKDAKRREANIHPPKQKKLRQFDLLYGQKGDFFLAGPTREIAIANAARVANQKTGFPSSCSLADSAI